MAAADKTRHTTTPFEELRGVGRLAAFALALIALTWGGWVGIRPAEARNARDAVAWANHDPIWNRTPLGFRVTSSYEHFADADWVPRWSHEGERSSTFGRWLQPPLGTPNDVDAWQAAASAAGWTYRGCSSNGSGPPKLLFGRTDGPSGATLRIANTPPEGLLATVIVPANAKNNDPGIDATYGRCRADNEATWPPAAQVDPLPDQPDAP
jgi:hypothetical protein